MRSSLQRAEADREQKHDADEQRLQHRVDVEHDEKVADGAHDEGAEDRADGAARAAEQRRAADHHRGDRVERVVAAKRRLGRAGIGERRSAAGRRWRRGSPRQRIGEDLARAIGTPDM